MQQAVNDLFYCSENKNNKNDETSTEEAKKERVKNIILKKCNN